MRGTVVLTGIVCALGLVSVPRAAATMSGALDPPECSGILPTDSDKIQRDDRSDRILRVDPLIVRFGDSVTSADSAYVAGLLRAVLPIMVDLVGYAGHPDTLNFVFSSGNYWSPSISQIRMVPPSEGPEFDDDSDGMVDEDPADGVDNDRDGRVDEDLSTSPNWDSAFVHELTHALTMEQICPFITTWIVEGVAEAGRYFIGEEMKRLHPERPMADARWPIHMAEADPYDRAGCQIGGGGYWYPSRANGEVAYRSAAAAIVIPCLAEIAQGRAEPHPLRRLVDALRAEDLWSGSLTRAVDRAWSCPIDGILPPSRWIGSRSVAYGAVRSNGAFLGVLPKYPETAVNPSQLQLFAFRVRDAGYPDRLIASGQMTFTGANGGSYASQSSEGVSPVPQMPPGAYRVDAEAPTPWPETPIVTGRNWIIITSSGTPALSASDGTAIIFADSTGTPVDLRDPIVNGRILERVPGGLLVAPLSGCLGDRMITVVSAGRDFGSVTIPGDSRGRSS